MAEKYVKYTGTSVFLTGKAGTGKTTFLKHIVETCGKRNVVVAPTGVAAINAGGSTIHSFFQLPFSMFLPSIPDFPSEYSMKKGENNLRKNKIKMLQSLDLLIIDEISMVRADLLDAIDDRLRQYRHNSRPFGGVQLLMIGDLYQLPPVVKDEEWQYMRRVYPSPFFFESKAFKKLNHITIELTHVYRQSEADFIDLLNNIRQNQLTPETLRQINTRYIPNFEPKDDEGYIRLTTHNAQADGINSAKLDALETEPRTFEAVITGTFPTFRFPTERALTLKVGAQVMFVRNDQSIDKRYFNGKIGTVTAIGEESVQVTDTDGVIINVSPVEWENTKYILNETSKEIESVVDGTFTQLPLRLAWAITVHKSQGLTFDKAIIDISRAFAFGQAYVAMSRCRTLKGMVLKTPLSGNCSFSNSDVDGFVSQIPPEQTVRERFNEAQSKYFFDTLFELFDFGTVEKDVAQLNNVFNGHVQKLFPEQAALFDENARSIVYNDIVRNAAKFQRQLMAIQAQCGGDTENAYLHERIDKGAHYFLEKTELFADRVKDCLDLEIENKEVAQKYTSEVQNLRETMGVKTAMLKSASEGFSAQKCVKARNDYMISDHEKSNPAKPTISLGKKAAELFDLLRQWRSAKSYELGDKPTYLILNQSTMIEISKKMPRTKDELLAIDGFGNVKFRDYGEEILELVNAYCQAQKPSKKQPKGASLEKTLEMLENGLQPEEIARQRELALSTIHSHILQLVKAGRIDASQFVPIDDMKVIARYMVENPEKPLREVMDYFDGRYRYFQLQLARFIALENDGE